MKRRHPDWARLPDEQLLARRIAGLRLSIRGTPVARAMKRLCRELQGRGLRLHPHAWVALEWFSPDGIPGIAVLFYLLHPRLRAAADGGLPARSRAATRCELMRILRHEAGHAIDNAFRLRRRAGWRAAFGPASRRYAGSYRPRPGAGVTYSILQGGMREPPAEDFAETFAVWLTPRSGWRRRYAAWSPALRKLHYVDGLTRTARPSAGRSLAARGGAGTRVETDARAVLRPVRRARPGPSAPRIDAALRRLFAPAGQGRRRNEAARLLREELPRLRSQVARELDVSEYLVGEVVNRMIVRSMALRLQLRGSRPKARAPSRVSSRRKRRAGCASADRAMHVKRLRILVLVHETLVPPETLVGVPEQDAAEFPRSSSHELPARMGHDVRPIGIGDSLTELRVTIQDWQPQVCFNLLEEFGGIVTYDQHVVAYLELLRQSYTGCNPRGMMLSRDKVLSKQILAFHRIPTPQFAVFRRGGAPRFPGRCAPLFVKSATQDASLGIPGVDRRGAVRLRSG